jgi:O-antigen/teichoic acid export membrane protein
VPAVPGPSTDQADLPAYGVRRVVLHTAANFASYALNTALALVVSVAVVRHLGRTEYGVMTFVVSYLSFFQILTSLSLDTVLIREAARRPAEAAELVSGALTLRFLLSAAAALLAWVVVPAVGGETRLTRLVMLHSGTFLFSFSALYLIRFSIELRGQLPNLVLAVWSIVYTLLRLALVAAGARVVHFLAADVGSAAVVLLLSRWVGARFSGFRPRFLPERRLWAGLLRESWPIALATGLIGLHSRLDQMLLFRLRGAGELGGYSVAVRLAEAWGVVTNVFLVSVFPLLARHSVEGGGRLERTSGLAYRYLYLVICPVSVILVLYPAPLLQLLFSQGFGDAAPALALLGLAEVFVFANAVTYNALFSRDRQREAAWLAGLSAAANAVLNLWLIPGRGATGAALATLASYALVSVLGLLLPGSRALVSLGLRALLRPAAAAAGMGVVLWALRPGLLPGLVLSALLWPVALLATRSLDRSDWGLWRRAVAGD